MTFRIIFFTLLMVPVTTYAVEYVDRAEVQAFVKELAVQESFNERDLLTVLRNAEYKQSVIDAMTRPAERTLTWAKYQDIFLTERRTVSGIEFMEKNPLLKLASSITSSCTKVAVCNNSIMDAAR